MRNLILIIALSVIPNIVKSQDKILLIDGREITCHVTKIDSLNIHFTIPRNSHTIETMIKKTDVLYVNLADELPAKKEKVNIGKSNRADISFGICIPKNDYASVDIFNDDAGFAGNGTGIIVNYKYFILPKFGFFAKGISSSNEYKAEEVGNAISYLFSLPVTNNTVKYTTHALIIGPDFIMPIDKLSLEGHAGIGIGKLKEPEVTYTVTSGPNIGWLKKNSVSGNAVLYNVGGGLVYNLNENWNIIGNVDYMEGSFKFGTNTVLGASGDSSGIPARNQYFEMYYITVGFGLKF